MRVIPDTKVGQIEFAEAHVTPWTANSTAIGTTAPAVTAWAAKVTAARAAYQAQQAAQNAAKAATNDLNVAMSAMAVATSDIIKQVRAKAATAGAGVYSLAEIPPPALPGPVGAPGTPYQLKVALKPNGSVELSWKSNNPAGCHGVIYQVYRKVESTGEYTYIGGSGSRKFIDLTVPAGVPSVMYQIQGTRTTAVGDLAEFIVNFGVTTGSGASATVTTTAAAKGTGAGTPAKLAA